MSQSENTKKSALDILREAWEADCIIDQANIDDEAARIPKLHSKYLNFLTEIKFEVFKRDAALMELRGHRSRYYQGMLNRDELEQFGWDQYQGRSPTRGELDKLLESDKIILEAEKRLFTVKAAFEYAEEIMKSLRYRGQDLKTIMEWKKFLAGN